MFQLITETIINDAKYRNQWGQELSDRWESSANKFMWVYPDKRFILNDRNQFEIADTVAAEDPTLSVGNVILPTITAGYHAQIHLKLRRHNMPEASFANDFVHKQKDFYLPVPKDVAYNADNYLLDLQKICSDRSYPFTVALDATNKKKVIFTTTDCHTNIIHLCIEEFAAEGTEAFPTGHEIKKITKGTVTAVASEGFGTYELLVKNNRMQTMENTRAFRTLQDETPMPGAKYSQIIVKQLSDRTITGLDAVGAVQKSVTTHVFWVRETGTLVTDFATALKTALTPATQP